MFVQNTWCKRTNGTTQIVEGDVDSVGDALFAFCQGVDVSREQRVRHEHAGAEDEHREKHGPVVFDHETTDADDVEEEAGHCHSGL